MRKTILAVIGLMLILMSAPAYADHKDGHEPPGQNKVGICHRTGSESNPYVYLEVPADEANGHITGTDKQHNEKVTWENDGTWRGVPHKAGDLRLDYYASSKSECEDTTVVQPSPPVNPTPPVVTPNPPVVTPEPPVVTPNPPVVTDEPPVTQPEPPVKDKPKTPKPDRPQAAPKPDQPVAQPAPAVPTAVASGVSALPNTGADDGPSALQWLFIVVGALAAGVGAFMAIRNARS